MDAQAIWFAAVAIAATLVVLAVVLRVVRLHAGRGPLPKLPPDGDDRQEW